MKQILALSMLLVFTIDVYTNDAVLYFECRLTTGPFREVLVVDRKQKKFIFRGEYLSNYKETEIKITAENLTRKYILDKVDGLLIDLSKTFYYPNKDNHLDLYECRKIKPFIE